MAAVSDSQSEERLKILQLKIKELGKGTGCHTIRIPDSCTFAQLHHVILIIKEWNDAKLHTFRVPTNQSNRTNLTPKIWVTNQRTIKHHTWKQDLDARLEHQTALSFGFSNLKDRVYYRRDFGKEIHFNIDLVNITYSYNDDIKIIKGPNKDAWNEAIQSEL